MITALIIAIVVSVIIYFVAKSSPMVDENDNIIKETETRPEPTPKKIEEIETVADVLFERAEETREDLEKRLESLTNPDSDKPFAKIAVTPDISELPVAEVKKPAKKRKPKAKKPEFPIEPVAETPAPTEPVVEKPKKKRPYKKRGPKKGE